MILRYHVEIFSFKPENKGRAASSKNERTSTGSKVQVRIVVGLRTRLYKGTATRDASTELWVKFDANGEVQVFEKSTRILGRNNFCVVSNGMRDCACLEDEHSEQARAPHTNGPRDVPRCGALSLLQKTLYYKEG